jgi:hypothetical protein
LYPLELFFLFLSKIKLPDHEKYSGYYNLVKNIG